MGGGEGTGLLSGDFYMILRGYRYTILSIQPCRTTLHPSFPPPNLQHWQRSRPRILSPAFYILISTSCPDIFEFTPCVLLPISLAAA